MPKAVSISIVWAASLAASSALAQEASPVPAAHGPVEAGSYAALEARLRELEARVAEAESRRDDTQGAERAAPPRFTLGGWVEAYYAWSFNAPQNGIINLRGFDNRHDSFNLANVALDAQWDVEGVNGRITLQWGSTPATYYLAETTGPALGAGVGEQDLSLWRIVQQAFVGYRIPIGAGLDVRGGLFLSPIGPEGMNVKDGWFFSRSNLFFGLPFYHTGLRISYAVVPEVTIVAWLINGWNTVLDNNDEKTLALQATWTTDVVSGSLAYMTGVERPGGAPEGRAWRHLLDLNATFTLTEWLGLQAQVAGMIEPNAFGTSTAIAGALAARVTPVPWLALSARGDVFYESAAESAIGAAAAVFWPTEWVSSFTGSVELRPHAQVSLRVEFRHDHAAGPSYFRGAVDGHGVTNPYIRNTRYQDTLTIGATAWF